MAVKIVACRSVTEIGILGRQAGPLGGRFAVEEAALHAAAEQQHARAAGEVAVQAVVVRLLEHVGLGPRLVLGRAAGDAFDHHVAAEFAGEDDERAVEQAALLRGRG